MTTTPSRNPSQDLSQNPPQERPQERAREAQQSPSEAFWPDGARLAVTLTLQFEAGGQPIGGAPGPIADPVLPGFPDLGQNSYYEYGAREGVPRLLDLFDKHGIKVSAYMVGEAVRRHPDVAHEIVRRGHEAGAHGLAWQRQYHMARPQETAWIAESAEIIQQATGTRPTGYTNYWFRPGVNTLEILSELGFRYHIDDLSADEPFLQAINGKPFATVPYTAHLNDIVSFDFAGFDPAAYERQVVDEFEQLFEEGAHRRRMMVLALHDRVSGHASRVRVLDRVLTRLRERDDVWWARKDQIADWVLARPESAAWVERAPAPVSGLPGPSA
ncbi:polysaccharide deacetylase family protein [Streptomyces sp. TS71-3]|uniref:polysaccharide deacetylase family protein n=1 Tax=Streptomyces sp. TS71-3 TaxID=2733862 RepID=UPI001B0F1E03|nr:polysaccharide deacetylase family protein [Streptomyces sp. TS71-3]GHJ36636.1 polysaccharide deacetylase [Streptomyces sp. TS71-3]